MCLVVALGILLPVYDAIGLAVTEEGGMMAVRYRRGWRGSVGILVVDNGFIDMILARAVLHFRSRDDQIPVPQSCTPKDLDQTTLELLDCSICGKLSTSTVCCRNLSRLSVSERGVDGKAKEIWSA